MLVELAGARLLPLVDGHGRTARASCCLLANTGERNQRDDMYVD